MRYTLKRNNILLLFLFFLTINIFSNEDNYYPINKIISFFKLETDYDPIFDKLVLNKQNKKAVVARNFSFILLDENKIPIEDFVITEQGQFFIPIDAAIKTVNFFSLNKLNRYYIKDGDICVVENEEKIEIDKTSKKTDENQNKEDLTNEKDENNVNKHLIKAIIIDPGHGGKDPGAVGYNSIKEKDIVLRTGLILKEKLKNKFKYKKIILTREKDQFIELGDRAKLANEIQEKNGQSLFISIHVNASRSKKSYGFETWYLVNNYSRKIVKKGEVSEDKEVENIINSMLNEEIYKESKYLANKIQKRLENKIGYVSRNRGVKEEVYFVIKNSVMPAVLVEIGFNTNKYEAIRLTNYSYLDKIASGIFEGIEDFVKDYEKTSGFSK
ncbi:MAG TPA: N-acetylmuramoyl-L-alanine amidase [Spirochaetota bacterium]|nr:N-acetylmuramoyl-L-alanine amidase [Spirochaetota bacterium]